jgi:hypothetical protein
MVSWHFLRTNWMSSAGLVGEARILGTKSLLVEPQYLIALDDWCNVH